MCGALTQHVRGFVRSLKRSATLILDIILDKDDDDFI